MGKRIKGISKSQYLKGMQCPKALWFYRHRPDLAPDIPVSQQALFDAGHEVGELAQTYFDNGIEITEAYYQIPEAITSTEKAVADGWPAIFEATARCEQGAYSRIDIFRRVAASDQWDMIEVKMSTTVKDYHLDDMALQRFAFDGAGYHIRKSILMHVNNQYVRRGPIDVGKLFILEDCTERVLSRMNDVAENVRRLLDTVNSREEPTVGIGPHCYDPFECDYTHHCMAHLPAYSVYDLFSGEKLARLLNDDIVDIRDIPEAFDVTSRQAIAVQSFKQDDIHVDKGGLRRFLHTLEYPLYFLDYETINPAVPLYDHSRPYQQIPFQFSLHIQNKKNDTPRHIGFLHTGKDDPRPHFVERLIDACGDSGSVVVYNQSFESRINRELGDTFPEYAQALDAIVQRMVDLLIPFRARLLYHPNMKGSASLKSVLPAFVADLSYDGLEIADGQTASIQFLSCVKDVVDAETRNRVYDNLTKYCFLDTLAEVRLLAVLYEHAMQ
jgi:hypothetical protein